MGGQPLFAVKRHQNIFEHVREIGHTLDTHCAARTFQGVSHAARLVHVFKRSALRQALHKFREPLRMQRKFSQQTVQDAAVNICRYAQIHVLGQGFCRPAGVCTRPHHFDGVQRSDPFGQYILADRMRPVRVGCDIGQRLRCSLRIRRTQITQRRVRPFTQQALLGGCDGSWRHLKRYRIDLNDLNDFLQPWHAQMNRGVQYMFKLFGVLL